MKEQETESDVDTEQTAREFNRRPSHSRTQSTPAVRPMASEREPLLRRRRSYDEHNADVTADADPVAGGTILGIHNLAIVFPQFIVSVNPALRPRRSNGFTGRDCLQCDLQGC